MNLIMNKNIVNTLNTLYKIIKINKKKLFI